MIQELQNRRSMSGDLGAGLGTGLGAGLQELAQQQMQSLMQQRQQQQASTGLQALGYTPEESSQLAQLPPQALQEIVKQKLQEPSRQAYSEALSGMLGMQPQAAGMQQQGMAPGMQPQAPGMEMQAGMQQQGMDQGAGVQQQGMPQQGSLSGLSEKQATDLVGFEMKRREMAAAILKERRKEEFIRERETRKETVDRERETRKETLPVYKELMDTGKGSQNNLDRLNRIRDLALKGDLGTVVGRGVIKMFKKGIFGFGLDLNALKTADAQEVDKLSADFVQDAGKILKGKVTNELLQAYFKTVPNLSQSREGMVRIADKLIKINKIGVLEMQEAKKIVKEYGKRPENISDLVDERVAPAIEQLKIEFSRDVAEHKKTFASVAKERERARSAPSKFVRGIAKSVFG